MLFNPLKSVATAETRVERDIVPILAADEQAKYHELINHHGDVPPASGKNVEEAVRSWQQSRQRR